MDILGNVIPFIGGAEEDKLETETLKMLGQLEDPGVAPARFPVSAQVNRVPVEHGHTACIAVELERSATPEDASLVLESWRSAVADLELPSAPGRAVAVTHAADRPQPRRDGAVAGGMTVTVGRIRPDPILDLRLVACGHNTVRGAAGASLLNAELMLARGMIPV
jgi:aspartate-semialdehyde dehydrogenase